jgi:hypothetical protein
MKYSFSALVCATVLASCANIRAADNDLPKDVREAFEKATEFDLYSLDPSRMVEKNKKDTLFHDWKVLGKTTLKGDTAKNVRAAIDKGRKDSDGSVAACFNPRHGVRIVHDKKTYDLVICYECLSATVFEGDKRIGQFLTTRSPEKTLTRVLADAKVPLPKERE